MMDVHAPRKKFRLEGVMKRKSFREHVLVEKSGRVGSESRPNMEYRAQRTASDDFITTHLGSGRIIFLLARAAGVFLLFSMAIK